MQDRMPRHSSSRAAVLRTASETGPPKEMAVPGLIHSEPADARVSDAPAVQASVELHIFAVVCFDDDGSGAAYGSDRIAARVAGANQIYEAAGFRLVFSPDDRIDVKSTLLAEDTTPGDPRRNAIARASFAAQRPDRITIFFRDWKVDDKGAPLPTMVAYGFSGDPRFVTMAKGDEVEHFAHEVGHFFGLWHTFGHHLQVPSSLVPDSGQPPDWAAWEKDLRDQQVKSIREYVVAIGDDRSRGLEVFDGDRPGQVHDTPPDDGGQLIYALNHGDKNGPIGEVDIDVDFGDGTPAERYVLRPDRQNVMSYFSTKPMHLSAGQTRVVRAIVDNGGARRLVMSKAWGDSPHGQDELRPAAVSWGPGHLIVAARGEAGRVFTKVWDADRGSWWPGREAWTDIGGDAVGSPVGVSWEPGRIDLVATMRDGRVYNKVWEVERDDWWPARTTWADIGGAVTGPPAVISWGPGHLFVAARGNDGQVLTKTWDADRGAWWPGQTDWLAVGGNIVGAPALVSWAPGRIDMIATGVDGRVYNKVWEADRGDWWPGRTTWEDLGGAMLGPPAAVSWGPGRLDVFARGQDGHAYNKVWEADRGGWWPGPTQWADIGAPPETDAVIGGGAVKSSLAAVTRQPGQLDVVLRAGTGRMYNKVWDAGSGNWWPGQTEWADIGGETIGVPVVVGEPGRLDVIARHFSGAIAHKAWHKSGSAWHPGQDSWDLLGRPWT